MSSLVLEICDQDLAEGLAEGSRKALAGGLPTFSHCGGLYRRWFASLSRREDLPGISGISIQTEVLYPHLYEWILRRSKCSSFES